MKALAFGLLALALPSIVHSVLDLLFGIARRRAGETPPPGPPTRWLVLVPSRGEGAEIGPTLLSTAAALAQAPGSDAVVVLDGPDAGTEASAATAGLRCVLKEPGGPSKGAVLSWAATHLRPEIDGHDGVLVFDAGNLVPSDLVGRLRLVGDLEAVQARVSSSGPGLAGAASLSDRFSQEWEDAGRQGLGWSVRLRGFGMGFRAAAFLRVAPLARTVVEDMEYSLLIPAAGGRIALAPPDVRVFDEKVSEPRAAAAQRARWFSGRWHLAAAQGRWIGRWIARAPAEGLAFVFEIGARPFSLTLPLRLVAGGLLVATGSPWAGGVAVASALSTLGALALAGTFPLGGGLRLAASWLRALTLLPAASSRWMRSRS